MVIMIPISESNMRIKNYAYKNAFMHLLRNKKYLINENLRQSLVKSKILMITCGSSL